MKSSLVYASVALSVLVVSVGGYYYWTHRTEVRVEVAPATPADPQVSPTGTQTPRPEHGDFDKRFKPAAPTADGGKPKD